VCVFHRHDVGHLRDAEQRGDARHQVLAEGGAGAEDMRVTEASFATCGASTCAMACALAALATASTRETPAICAASGGDGRRIGREHDDIDGFGLQRLRGGDALRRRCIELAVEVFGNDEDLVRHSEQPLRFQCGDQFGPRPFTITPLLRLAGGA
jgi:hypothetical protein